MNAPTQTRDEAIRLLKQYKHMVWSAIKRLGLMEHPDRDDLAQEVLLALWIACLTFDPAKGKMKVRAWWAARRAIIDTCRRLRAAKVLRLRRFSDFDRDDLLEILAAPADSSSESQEKQEARRKAERLLAILDSREAKVVRRRFMEGEAVQAIATTLAVHRRTVCRLITGALSRMAEVA